MKDGDGRRNPRVFGSSYLYGGKTGGWVLERKRRKRSVQGNEPATL